MAGGEGMAKKSDFGVRTLSAVVMLAVAGMALWLGGLWWQWFVLGVGLVCYGEFVRIILRAFQSTVAHGIWLFLGLVYFAISILEISFLPLGILYHGDHPNGGALIGIGRLLSVLGLVICTDVGAYFAGRTIGGPKIAPAISPSKTWAGLIGGMICAGLWGLFAVGLPNRMIREPSDELTIRFGLAAVMSGAVMAIVAQAGDFLESWLKRKAGMKDSSGLIPGHGGVFDRIDGLLAVALVSALAGDWLIFADLF